MSGLKGFLKRPSLPTKEPAETPIKSEPELAPLPPKDAKIVRYPRCNREMALGYETLLKNCYIKNEKLGAVDSIAKRILKNKERYNAVGTKIHMPWELIGALHNLEASGNFKGVMHNGELIIGTGKKTRLVPAGRGPFPDWESSAIDAFGIETKRPAGYRWDVANTLYYGELFNGFGYRNKGINSPYLWSFTNNYTAGKYVADGVWSRTAVSQQCGVAPILMVLGWKPESWV